MVVGIRDTWRAEQFRWADEHGCTHDPKGYVNDLSCNLFQPMSLATKDDFSHGGGGELRAGRRASQPKMQALHSSSVLACNVFDYWRSNGVGPVGKALGVGPCIERLTFEAKFPTGLPGEPPNIDVALWLESGHVWGIESKFTEPFGPPKPPPVFKGKYFPDDRPVWSDRGLIKCGALADALQKREFRHLDAAQLLKHALGLHKNHQDRFTLCYLYVDDRDSPECSQHRNEITKFAEAVDGDFPFVPLSYIAFLKRLRDLAGEGHDTYFAYICERYRFVEVMCRWPGKEQTHPARLNEL